MAARGAIRWDDDACRFEVAGHPDMWGRAEIDARTLRVTLGGFPPGMTVRVQDASVEVDEHGDATLEANITAALGQLPLEGELPFEGVRVTVASSGGAVTDVPLPSCVTVGQPMRTLWNATREPVLFDGEREEQGPIRTIIARENETTPGWTVGASPRAARDVDAIAVIERSTIRNRPCDGYRDQNGRSTVVWLRVNDATVTVYARRTGRSFATRHFDAIDRCPGSALTWGSRSEADSPTPDITPWLETLLTPTSEDSGRASTASTGDR